MLVSWVEGNQTFPHIRMVRLRPFGLNGDRTPRIATEH